ncbi:MAG: adenylosuccinate lyase [Candidatus Bathyarchaeota archaeon]|nr:MAG: adenylosuccinate lyase [Candidatus Bathyarchaeota archaeon]
MPILPIETGRYGTEEMKSIFEEESKLQRMLDVEGALAWAHAQVGDIPQKDAEIIMRKASTQHVKLHHVKAIEAEIVHDVAAIVRALADQSGSSGAYVHLGATSYDIVDTATALALKDAVKLIDQKLGDLELVLIEKADKHKTTIMVGRTHGQHALPTTLGFKFAVWMRQNARNIQRLKECSKRLLVGKITGAVGTQAGLGQNAKKIQELVMKKLGLSYADISTQIVQRDRLAEFICVLALIASSLETIATEIRQLQRPEIAEVFEAFDRKKRVGSSTMPQKRDPETCETVCGLAKIVRSLVPPSLENVKTWHERDMTQSSAERFLIPEACIIVDDILARMVKVLANLQVDTDRMRKNVDITRGRMMAESVMTTLVRNGMNRQEAHELLRKLASKSERQNSQFKDVLSKNKQIRKYLTLQEIECALDPHQYLGTAFEQVSQMIEKTRQEAKSRA